MFVSFSLNDLSYLSKLTKLNLDLIDEIDTKIEFKNNKELVELTLKFYTEYNYPIELSNNKNIKKIDFYIWMYFL